MSFNFVHTTSAAAQTDKTNKEKKQTNEQQQLQQKGVCISWAEFNFKGLKSTRRGGGEGGQKHIRRHFGGGACV